MQVVFSNANAGETEGRAGAPFTQALGHSLHCNSPAEPNTGDCCALHPRREAEAHWQTICVCDCVNLAGQSALRTTHLLFAIARDTGDVRDFCSRDDYGRCGEPVGMEILTQSRQAGSQRNADQAQFTIESRIGINAAVNEVAGNGWFSDTWVIAALVHPGTLRRSISGRFAAGTCRAVNE